MKLENQVCSLDLAKRLKELGVKQESLFYWENIGNRWLTLKMRGELVRNGVRFCPSNLNVSAFTTSELGELLPKEIVDYDCNGKEYKPRLYICRYLEDFGHNKIWSWKVSYHVNYQEETSVSPDESLANVLAYMLVYLLENHIITL